jgi:hypothetical protein
MTSSSQCTICRDLNPPLKLGQKESTRWCLLKQVWEKAVQGCTHCQLLKASVEAVEDDQGKTAIEESGVYTSQDFRIICGKTEHELRTIRCVLVTTMYRLTFDIFGVEGMSPIGGTKQEWNLTLYTYELT